MKREEREKRGVQGLGSQMLSLPPPLLPHLPRPCTVTAVGFLLSSMGLMKCPGQANGGGAFLGNLKQMLRGAEWVVRESALIFSSPALTMLIQAYCYSVLGKRGKG